MSAEVLAGSVPFAAGRCSERRPVHHPERRPDPIRLTRRGRVVVIGLPVLLLTALLVSGAAFFTSTAQAAGSAGEPLRTVAVHVAPGDTLWSVAAGIAPDRDPRDVVAEIVELNALEDSVVHAGQQLHVPAAP